jgi:enoyl-CoA hydratase
MTELLVNLERTGRKAEITVNRPDKLNALDRGVLEQLRAAASDLKSDPDLSVLVIRSAGDRAFVAGADIASMSGLSSTEARDFALYGQKVFSMLAELPAVVLAQVQGHALGGGFELALCADIIVASKKARFGLPEVGLGLIPGFGGTQRLRRRVGYGRAVELAVTARQISAEEALGMGIVNSIAEPDELGNVCGAVVSQILSQGPLAVRAAKLAVRQSMELPLERGLDLEAELFGKAFGNPESREGIAAFLEKRRPHF